MRIAALAALLLSACAPAGPELRLSWEKDILSVTGPGVNVKVWYLEAYCRPGSTDRDWNQTVIPHKTEKLEESADGKLVRLRCRVEGGVEVEHTIRAAPGEVDFQVEAVNRGPARVEAHWVQPCIRVGEFTGGTQESYVAKSFIFVEGKPVRLDKLPRAEEARYRGGQVYVPRGISRADVNPRPLSAVVPSNGLIGCVSADESMLLANAWEPTQELFQGVIICLHSDFRLGGLDPGQTKRARGKIYIMKNDPEALLARYRRDFP